jgi:hypothetical protein
MMKIEGSGSESGSISQRHGSADPDPDPDPHQNGMDPQHRVQRLPTTPFSLVLRKEYVDCPERDSHAVHYI